MRVRSAGGLLLAPLLSLASNAAESLDTSLGSNRTEIFLKSLFWPEPDGGREVAVTIIRDGIFGLAAVVGVAALLGLRASRWPAVIMSALLALLHLPWVIWNYEPNRPGDLPPDWVFEYVPWYSFGRYAALVWIVVLAAAALFALTDRRDDSTTRVVTTDHTAPATTTVPATPAGFGPPPATGAS
jgi:hypothetical protein